MENDASLSTAQKRRILRRAIAFTGVTCCVVSLFALVFYERSDWAWELFFGNTTAAILTFTLTVYSTVQSERVAALTEEMKSLIDRDRLTGAATRHFFFQALDEMGEVSGVSLMVDVDHFKAVNDNHGHLVGDDALRGIVRGMSGFLRAQDLICRFGGEEFVIFLPGAKPSEAAQVAERIRLGVEALQIETTAGELGLTISIGGAFKAGRDQIEDAIRRADLCLYEAKNTGRNRVVMEATVNPDGPRSGGGHAGRVFFRAMG